jgi:hypothetical protein
MLKGMLLNDFGYIGLLGNKCNVMFQFPFPPERADANVATLGS